MFVDTNRPFWSTCDANANDAIKRHPFSDSLLLVSNIFLFYFLFLYLTPDHFAPLFPSFRYVVDISIPPLQKYSFSFDRNRLLTLKYVLPLPPTNLVNMDRVLYSSCPIELTSLHSILFYKPIPLSLSLSFLTHTLIF